MPPKLYEFKVFKEDRPVGGINPFLAGLDLDPRAAETTAALLTRHLLGAARRDKAHPREEHLYHLEVRDVDSNGKGAGQPLFRWVLPIPEEEA